MLRHEACRCQHDSEGAPLRPEFEDLIRRELLGLAGGEQETITEQSVRNRYLLGMLAQMKVIEVDGEPFDELADGPEDNAEKGNRGTIHSGQAWSGALYIWPKLLPAPGGHRLRG